MTFACLAPLLCALTADLATAVSTVAPERRPSLLNFDPSDARASRANVMMANEENVLSPEQMLAQPGGWARRARHADLESGTNAVLSEGPSQPNVNYNFGGYVNHASGAAIKPSQLSSGVTDPYHAPRRRYPHPYGKTSGDTLSEEYEETGPTGPNGETAEESRFKRWGSQVKTASTNPVSVGGAKKKVQALMTKKKLVNATDGTCRVKGCNTKWGPTDCKEWQCVCKADFTLNDEGVCTPTKGICSKVPVGRCRYYRSCDKSRGPTICQEKKCVCKPGYCNNGRGKCMTDKEMLTAEKQASAASGNANENTDNADAEDEILGVKLNGEEKSKVGKALLIAFLFGNISTAVAFFALFRPKK